MTEQTYTENTKPATVDALMQRANALAGLNLKQIADQHGIAVPPNLKRDKGWIGQLLETALGAQAASLPIPDFPELGIELKTIPVGSQGKPVESTFICTLDLCKVGEKTWETSLAYKKLACVLWIPIETAVDLALAERRIGMPLLWRPNPEQAAVLKADWEELTDMVSLGQLEAITARHGRYLQIRPKAANAKSLRWGFNADGEKVLTLPRGFYLRPSFTAEILRSHYLI